MRFSAIGFFLVTLLLLETHAAPLDNTFQSAKPDNFPDESAVVSSRKVVKTAENGQDYEYEYLYYYDDAENDTTADVRDDLLLDLTKQEKSSGEPREDLQSISEEAAFSEKSHMGIQMKTEHPVTEEVHTVSEVPLVTPAVTTTPEPVTTPRPERLERPSDDKDIRKTRPGSNNSNRIRPKTTSTPPSPKAAVSEKESDTQAVTRKTPSRGKNRFSLSTTERTAVETSDEKQDVVKSQSTRTSSSPRRRINSSRQTENSTPTPVREPSTSRRNPKKTSSQDPAPEVAPVLPKAAEESVRLQPEQPVEVRAPAVGPVQKSSFNFEEEIKALDAEEDLRDRISNSVPEVPEVPVAMAIPLGDVLTGQDELAAHQLTMDAKTAELEVMLDAVEPLRTVAESTTSAAVNEDGRSTELSMAFEENKVEPAQNMDTSDPAMLNTEAETTASPAVAPVPSSEPISVTEVQKTNVATEIPASQPVEEPQQAPTPKQVDAKEESKLSGRTNRVNQQRGRAIEASRGTGGRKSTKAPANEETTTTTTTTTAATSTRSLFNNRGRIASSRFGQSKLPSRTEEAPSNFVTEATTTTTTAKVAVTRRPFGPSLRRTSTTTEQPKEETKPAEPVPVAEATPSTTAATNSVVRGRQRFNVQRGFRVSDEVSPNGASKPESVSTTTTQAPVETSTSATKPSKTATRTRPSVLLRSRTTTTEASAPAEAIDRVDTAPETVEVETVQDEPKQPIAPKKSLKSFKVEVSTEAPVSTTAQSNRLNLLKNRPALVVSERPKAARNDVNPADRKNRFSIFLKKSANQTEEVKTPADETKEEPAEAKQTPEALAPAQEAVEEPKTVEIAEVKPLPIQNRLRGNRRPGQIATSRRGAEAQQPSNQ